MNISDFLKSCRESRENGYDVPYSITYGGNILELWLSKFEPEERGKALVDVLAAKQYDTPSILNLLKAYDWQIFSGATWSQLLSVAPEYADQCNWEKFDSNDWNTLLERQPQFIDKCNYCENLKSETWISILRNQPQWMGKCNKWNKFSPGEWCKLLQSQPQFADRCDRWKDFHKNDWVELLSQQPTFADRCNQWDQFKREWGELLSKQPQFADKCDKWDFFSSKTWVKLLSEQPQFATRCNNWDFDFQWEYLLSRQPQFADKCNWKYLTDSLRLELLKTHPEFIDRCACCTWSVESIKALLELFPHFDRSRLDPSSWAAFCAIYPEVGRDCPWEIFTGRDWSRLVRRNPDFADQCVWEKLNLKDWLFLLEEQPQFADRCPYLKQMTPQNWAEQLVPAPKLETLYNQIITNNSNNAPKKKCWNQFSSKEWLRLLSYHPQFYQYCDRAIFDPEDWQKLLLQNSIFICECKDDELNENLLWRAIREHVLPKILFIDYWMSEKDLRGLVNRESGDPWLKSFLKKNTLIGKVTASYSMPKVQSNMLPTDKQIISARHSPRLPSINKGNISMAIQAFVEQQNKNKETIGEVIVFQHTCNDIEIAIALQYTKTYTDNLYCSSNGIYNIEGGTHLRGFQMALLRVFNSYTPTLGNNLVIKWTDAAEGLTAVVMVQLPNLQLGGQTQTKLENQEVRECVEAFFYEAFDNYLKQHSQTAREICDHVIMAARARKSAQQARQELAW